MASIKWGRVVGGGLLAGLIMNVGEAVLHGALLARAGTEAYLALGRTVPADPVYLASLVVLTFAQGILAVWLYAAIRPRYGPGPAAALRAGLTVWFFSAVYAAVYLHSGLPGLLPAKVVWPPVAWDLFEFPLATLAGAAIYKEGG
jgi:hypothetical protein